MVENPTIEDITDAVTQRLFLRGTIAPPVKKRLRMNWESRFAREYISKVFPNEMVWFRKEVGPVPVTTNPELYKKIRRWADCIILLSDVVIIQEYKMRPEIKAVSQIYAYLQLFPETPEFLRIKDMPLRGQIVTTDRDNATERLAKSWGIEYVIYKPTFYQEWFTKVIEGKSRS